MIIWLCLPKKLTAFIFKTSLPDTTGLIQLAPNRWGIATPRADGVGGLAAQDAYENRIPSPAIKETHLSTLGAQVIRLPKLGYRSFK